MWSTSWFKTQKGIKSKCLQNKQGKNFNLTPVSICSICHNLSTSHHFTFPFLFLLKAIWTVALWKSPPQRDWSLWQKSSRPWHVTDSDRFWQMWQQWRIVNVFKLSYISWFSWTPIVLIVLIVLCMLLALDHSLNPVAFFSIICLLLVRPSSMKQLPGAC